MSDPNYGGKMANSSAYIKTFNPGNLNDLWVPTVYVLNKLKINVLTPTIQKDIYIPNNIYIGGDIIHVPSQKSSQIIENVTPISTDDYNPILDWDVEAIQYNIKNDPSQKIYYGYHSETNDTSSSSSSSTQTSFSSSYLDIHPLLILKIKDLQNQIICLQNQIDEIQNQ